MNSRVREKSGIFLVASIIGFIVLYFILAIVFSQWSDIWWDEASYLGMGKYFFSQGAQGVFEPVKSVGLPLLLGLGWFSGLDIVIFGKILIFLAGFFSLLFVYLIGKELFNEKIGGIAALIILFNALFLVFMFRIYTEVPSMCLILGAVYFMIVFSKKQEYKFLFLSSLFLILVSIIKYPNIFLFGVLNLYLLYFSWKNRKIRPLMVFNLFSFVLAFPFLLINYLVSGDFLYYFHLSQGWLANNLSSVYSLRAYPLPKLLFESGDLIYFKSIAYLFNFILPFFFVGAYKIIKNRDLERVILILVPILLFFCFFEINYLKQERYIMIIFPFMSLLIASAIKKVRYLFILFVIINFGITGAALKVMSNERAYYNFFIKQDIDCSSVSTSDPRTVINYKTNMPYELFDERWEDSWIARDNPDCIFFFSCYDRRGEIINRLNELGYNSAVEKNTGRCLYAVFKKAYIES